MVGLGGSSAFSVFGTNLPEAGSLGRSWVGVGDGVGVGSGVGAAGAVSKSAKVLSNASIVGDDVGAWTCGGGSNVVDSGGILLFWLWFMSGYGSYKWVAEAWFGLLSKIEQDIKELAHPLQFFSRGFTLER